MTERMTLAQYRNEVRRSSVSPSGRVVAVSKPMARKIGATVDKPARSKFGNVKTTVDGIVFDSKREALHWQQLVLRAGAGQITDLKRQVRYELHVCGVKVCTYSPDFEYWEGDQLIVADSKGMKTQIYNLKKKMLAAEYGLDVVEM